MRAAAAPTHRVRRKERVVLPLTRAHSHDARIRPIAPLPLALDELGLVPRCPRLSLDAVDARFAPILEAIGGAARAAAEAATSAAAVAETDAQDTQHQPQHHLLGVYLRGSVPRGLFLEGISDVDAIALVVAAPGASTAAAAAAAERAARDALAARLAPPSAAAQAIAELRPTKIELRVHCVPPREADLLLQRHSSAGAEAPLPLPPSLARRALGRHLAFELATSAVALPPPPPPPLASSSSLLDLPSLLPDVARLPPAPWLLPAIAADVDRAVRASTAAAPPSSSSPSSSPSSPSAAAAADAAAARWALKRCVRAALELQFLGSLGAGPAAAAKARVPLRWTRDLYHCAALTRAAAESGACPLSARVAGAVDEALALYVGLLGEGEGEEEQGGQAPAPAGERRRRDLVRAACDHAQRLADALDAAFLAAMLSEAPGWVTKHAPPPPPPPRARAAGGWSWRRPFWRPPSGAGSNDDNDGGQNADNIAPPGQPPLLLVGCDPPPVHVRVSGPPALQFDWGAEGDGGESANRAGAGAALAAALVGSTTTTTAAAAAAAAAAVPQPQPVLLRGFAARWPAARRWSFWVMLVGGAGTSGTAPDARPAPPVLPPLRGKARAAPSLAFPFCEPQLRDVLVAARGPAAAPSLEVDGLLASEFVRRMLLPQQQMPPPPPLDGEQQKSSTSPPWPPSRPYLYLQAELPDGHPMHDDVRGGLEELAAILEAAAAAGTQAGPPVRIAQRPRLWASARGSVSPTHFDRDASVLVQVVGRKRMLLFPPDQLECLLPYPEQHLLRRRARVNLAAEAEAEEEEEEEERGAAAAGLRSRLEAVEVVLEPGDAVFFPAEWAHYTESLTPSMSVTTRFALGGGDGGAAQGSAAAAS